MKHFSASGGDKEGTPETERLQVAALRDVGNGDSIGQGMEQTFTSAVSNCRAAFEEDKPATAVARALLDLCWGAWAALSSSCCCRLAAARKGQCVPVVAFVVIVAFYRLASFAITIFVRLHRATL